MAYSIAVDPAYIPEIEKLTTRQLGSANNIKQRAKRSAADVNREGLIGEFAVCQYFALDPLAHVTRNGSDGGVDLMLPGSSKTIQIKYRPTAGRDMLVPSSQPLKCDVAILAENDGDPLRVRLVGWTTKEEFTKHATRRRFRPELPEDYMLPRGMLKPMHEIWGVL